LLPVSVLTHRSGILPAARLRASLPEDVPVEMFPVSLAPSSDAGTKWIIHDRTGWPVALFWQQIDAQVVSALLEWWHMNPRPEVPPVRSPSTRPEGAD
jgi:hypothetical protein